MTPASTVRARWPWVAPAALAVLLVLVAPGLAPVLVPAAQLGSALVLVLVLLRRARSGTRVAPVAWSVAVVVVLMVVASALAVRGPGGGAERAVVLLGQVFGCVTLVPVVARYRRVQSAVDLLHGWADAAVATVGTAVGVGLVVVVAAHGGVGLGGTLTLGGHVVVVALVVWLRLTRQHSSTAVLLLMHAAVLFSVHDAARVLLTGSTSPWGWAVDAAGVVAAALFAAAGAHRSLDDVGSTAALTELRRSSARVRLVVPFAAVPPLAWAVGSVWPQVALPPWVPQLSGILITALALWRVLRLLVDAERAADFDHLTGLLDRRGLKRHLDERPPARRPAWLCLIDLDDFKLVNDQRGHDAGDALLVAIAARLVERLPAGTTAARLGGDELVVVLERATAEQAAAEVLAVFAHPFALSGEGEGVRISASVGVTPLGAGDDGASALVCADVAMYVAKSRGRDQWVAYEPSLREQVLGVGQVQRELRTLLGGSGDPAQVGSLVVHYQPVVDLVTGRPHGVEALVRWYHPRRGTVPPDSFLPLAESAGLAAALDRWVLHQALHQVAAWDAAGLVGMTRVGVNLGVSSVRSPSLRADVEQALAASGTTADRLLLEITEHDELQADRAAAECLLALRDAGVTIALDDFGAGYASIGYLRRWPVNLIKLDRSLLPRAVQEGAFEAVDDPAELLDGVAALAGALGHELVAEGIETPDDDRAVRAVGVRYGQGWLYARDLPADELATWWAERCTPADPRATGADSARAVPSALLAGGAR